MDKKLLWIFGGGLALIVILIIVVIALGTQNKKPTEVTLTFWNLSEEKTSYEKVIDKFQKDHPTVKINYVKKDPKEYLNEALNEIAAGKGPDIWAIPNDWMAKYHDKLVAMPEGKLADKKNKKTDLEVYQDNFYPVAAQNNIIDDKIYGIPLVLETLSLYYNSTILQNALTEYQKTTASDAQNNYRLFTDGPTNWDELSKLSQIITQKSGRNITLSGVALGTADKISNANDLLTVMMLQDGAKMTTDDLTAAQFHTATNVFDGPTFPGAQALEFYTGFADPQSKNYAWNDDLGDSVRAFAEGKTAMMINYPSTQSEVKRINPNLNFKLTNLPQVKETKNPLNYASYNTFTVTRTSQNPETAWDFILFLTNQENARDYQMDAGKTSTLARRSSSNEDNPANTAQSWYKPDPQKANEIFLNMIRQVGSGQAAQTALDGAAAEITTLLMKLKI